MRNIVFCLLCFFPLGYCIPAFPKTPRNPEVALGILYEDVARQLLVGGVTVFIPPVAATGRDQTDVAEWWKHCPLSRAVSSEGQQQAADIYGALKTLGVRIGYIESSELCLALSTASFVTANASRIYTTPDLNPIELQALTGINEDLYRIRAQAHFEVVFEGSVSILVGFVPPSRAALHPVLTSLVPGETAIFRPGPSGKLDLIARLTSSQWREMGQYLEQRARIPKRATQHTKHASVMATKPVK